jgi:phosphatidylethanolamine-binding protein (PEBP) family uncharacterized protein
MSQTTTCLCILSLVTLLGCSEEKASLLADGGPILPAADAGRATPPTARPLDGGLDGGRRDAGRDRDDEGDEGNEDDENAEPEDEGDIGPDAGRPTAGNGSMMRVSVPAIDERGILAAAYRCSNGQTGGVSPEISWTPGPPGTRSYAVTLRAINWVQAANWTIFDIPADVTTLPENIPAGAEIEEPVRARQAYSQSRPLSLGYFGPCGLEKQYELSVYALKVDALPGLEPEPSFEAVDTAIAANSIGNASESFSSAP